MWRSIIDKKPEQRTTTKNTISLMFYFNLYLSKNCVSRYTLSETWGGVNFADHMAAQRAFGTDFHDRSILRPKHRAYYRSGRPVIKIGPKCALGIHEIRPIHSAPSLGLSIPNFARPTHMWYVDTISVELMWAHLPLESDKNRQMLILRYCCFHSLLDKIRKIFVRRMFVCQFPSKGRS